jgi:hypothetical protein
MSSSRPVPARTLGLLACFGLFFVAPRARALELALEVGGCTDLAEKRVQELMQLELTAEVARPAAAVNSAALVSVTCTGDTVRISVSDATTSKVVSRTFTLTEREPDVRARAVALAAAELVITSWMELVLAKPTEPAKPAPAWVSENRRAATSIVRQHTERGLRVAALFPFAAGGGTFHAHPGTWGGGLRLELVFGAARFGADTDLSLTLEDEKTALGDVRTNTWSLGLRPALRFESAHWLGTLGIGARLGLARIAGTAADPTSVRSHVVAGTWGGPLAHANLGVSFTHVVLRLGVEAGFALRNAWGTVDGQAESGVRGPWFFGTLGVGWGA